MLTNNFYRMLQSHIFRADGNWSYPLVRPDGTTTVSAGGGSNYLTPLTNTSDLLLSTGYYGVCFGTGNTPATKEDYCLEAMITSGLSSRSSSALTDKYENYWVRTVTMTVQNTSEQDIIISEVGYMSTVKNGSEKNYVLVDRTVLDSPITIPPGENKAILYSIRINFPA